MGMCILPQHFMLPFILEKLIGKICLASGEEILNLDVEK
jgi:hypothetical protein